jgi:hypothetical protein
MRCLGKKYLYMVIERFRNGDAVSVYRRFRDRGRMQPEGLSYLSSWIDDQRWICYQVMETDDPQKLEEWMEHWRDLIEFEAYPVITSREAAESIRRLL